MTASFVELFQKIVVGCQVDSSQSVLITDFWDAPCTELIEAVETQTTNTIFSKVCLVILVDDLLNEFVFCLCYRTLTAFPNQHDKVFQESQFLDIPFFSLDLEGIHRDGMLFGIRDILAVEVFTQSFIRITCVHQHDVSILLMGLAYHGIDVKTLAAA